MHRAKRMESGEERAERSLGASLIFLFFQNPTWKPVHRLNMSWSIATYIFNGYNF